MVIDLHPFWPREPYPEASNVYTEHSLYWDIPLYIAMIYVFIEVYACTSVYANNKRNQVCVIFYFSTISYC